MTYFLEHGPASRAVFPNGLADNATEFPVAAVETAGAILFADLPEYAQAATSMSPAETACYVSHFFAWFDGSAGKRYGGMVDKFIGDAVMMVFLSSQCRLPPLEAALRTACDVLQLDTFGFKPKFGIACGPFAVALVGTEEETIASAMGHTVNVASRCVERTVGPSSVTVATTDEALVKAVFSDFEGTWSVHPPRQLEVKHMAPLQVIDVVCRTTPMPERDYGALVKKRVQYARENGAIVSDRKDLPAGAAPKAAHPDAGLLPAELRAPSTDASRLLAATIREGLVRCAERLSRVCHAEWRLETLAVGAEALNPFAALLDGVAEDHFGIYCSMPGAAFLVILDRKSGLKISARFLGGISEKVAMLENLEPAALGEVSSMLSNVLADSLAGASDTACLISAPETMLDDTRSLLQNGLKRFGASESLAMVSHGRLVCPELHSELTLVVFLAADLIERAGPARV